MIRKRYRELLARFAGRKIVLVGDFIADEYVFCETSRVSREAPVLILHYLSESLGMGGGLNVAHNLSALGADVSPTGLLGDDRMGSDLLRFMEEHGMNRSGVIVDRRTTTITKTRIMACSLHTTMQQVLRIDRGQEADDMTPLAPLVEERALSLVTDADAVILSDYGYGSLTDNLLECLRKRVAEDGLIVTADSRYNLRKFRGVTAVTPNEPEVQTYIGGRMKTDQELFQAGRRMMDELALSSLLITRGRLGMAAFDLDHDPLLIPVYGSDEVADVTGAGDTVIATFTLALAAGASTYEAAVLSNLAGGISVTKRGAAVVRPDELLEAIDQGFPDA